MNKIIIRNTNKSEEARKKICLEQLAQDRQLLLITWPFIGSIIMRMELIPVRDDRLDTASTDSNNIFVDIKFYSKLSPEERLFVLAHEVWHSVLLHFARRQKREIELFNIACDLEIHFTLQSEHMKEPFVLPHDPAWKNLSAEEIYEKLLSIRKQQNSPGGKHMSIPSWCAQKGNAGKTISSFGDGQSSFDKHLYQNDPPPSPQSQGNGENGENGEGKSDNQDGKNGELGSASNPFVIDQDYAPLVTSESVEQSRSRTIAAAQQIERRQGTLPANLKALLDKLQKPSLPWQEMLKQFVTTCYGGKRRWLPPARRYVWQDLYLPSIRDESLKAVVALDTSGSTKGDLPTFFGELVSLMRSFGKFELDVIQCDAKIQLVEHYTEANLPSPDKKWNVKGFGGTDFRPVFEYIQKQMREQPDLLLFFTDGYGTAPERRPPYPVMWVLTSDGDVPAEWGRVTHFKKEN